MSLDILHHVVCEKDAVEAGMRESTLVENIVDYPEEFKNKFADDIFYSKVAYVDWNKTFKKVVGLSANKFNEKFLCYKVDEHDTWHFVPVDCDNPISSKEKISITSEQQIKVMRRDPHIYARSKGSINYGMSTEFFEKFSNFEVICDLNKVKQMQQLTTTADAKEDFFSSFIYNWEDRSYVIVTY